MMTNIPVDFETTTSRAIPSARPIPNDVIVTEKSEIPITTTMTLATTTTLWISGGDGFDENEVGLAKFVLDQENNLIKMKQFKPEAVRYGHCMVQFRHKMYHVVLIHIVV